jgi:hypothetical protein
MSKQTGLAAFTRKAVVQPEAAAPPSEPSSSPSARKRGKGDIVSLTVRVSRADWERVHQLAVAEGTSIQQLALKGLSKVFAEKGLPGMTP